MMIKYVVVMLALSSTMLIGQSSISGYVTDENNEPLPYVNVLYFSSDTSLIKADVTDDSGRYKFEIISNDGFLRFSYIGYDDQELYISSLKTQGNVKMLAIGELIDELIITAKKPMLQRMGDKLVMNVENSLFATGSNTIEVLKKAPGVMVDHNENISLNGRSGVRIYIDGKDTQLAGNQLSALLEGMPSEGIEKIEIISNPSARYEAQGSAGIIDIITKRGKLFGTNGSFSVNSGAGHYFRWDNNISINHRTDKYNLFGSYSFAKRNQYMEIIIDRTFFEDSQINTQVDMYSLFKLPIENHSPRLGGDFYMNDKLTIGFTANSFVNLTGQDATNEIETEGADGGFQLFQLTDTRTKTDWFQYNANVHLDWNISDRSKLTLNFDNGRYNNDSDQLFDSQFLDENNLLLFSNALLGTVDGSLKLFGFSGDYSQELSGNQKLELGWKNTHVTSDNKLDYYDEQDGVRSYNDELSNQFVYNEKIQAAYANYSFGKGQWNYSLGLRLERTDIEGEQIITEEKISQDYLNLFPSSSVNYTLNDNHIFGVSFSRRLDRPSYGDLNPFRFFVNNYTYRVGNPTLTPQFTWSTELNYTLFQRYYLAINYARIVDNLTRGIFQEEGEDYVVVKPVNIKDLNSLSISLSVPIDWNDRWSSSLNANASFNDYNGVVGGFEFERVNPIYIFNLNNNIDLGKSYRMQIHVFYLPSHYVSITKIKDISQVFIGFQKRLLNNRATIAINIHDIFYQGYPEGQTIHGNIDDIFISKRDSRYGMISFSYNFGKQSVRTARNRRSAVQDELNRARQTES